MLLFVLALTLPAGLALVRPLPAEALGVTGEKLAPFPTLDGGPEALLRAPARFKSWFRDRFGLRDTLIRWNARLRVELLGVSSSPRVVVGRDGWLFYADEQAVENFRAVRPYTPRDLQLWRIGMERWRGLLAGRRIPLLFVVAPDKATVYPEQMPRWATRANPQTRLDQLLAALGQPPGVEVIDLRPALAGARRGPWPLYFRTDTHWNELGAYVAFRELSGALARHFPAVEIPPPPERLAITSRPFRSGGDLTRFLGLPETIVDEEVLLPPVQRLAHFPQVKRVVANRDMAFESLTISERPGAPIPRALVVRDSFSNALMPWMAELFGHGVYLWTTTFDRAVVDQVQPDVVIVEMVERTLMRPPETVLGFVLR